MIMYLLGILYAILEGDTDKMDRIDEILNITNNYEF